MCKVIPCLPNRFVIPLKVNVVIPLPKEEGQFHLEEELAFCATSAHWMRFDEIRKEEYVHQDVFTLTVQASLSNEFDK